MNEKQKRIADILAYFSEMHNKSLSENAAKIYMEILESYELPALEKSFQALIKDHALSRFPLPADFIKHIEPPAEKIFEARQAFNKAIRAVELQCRINSVSFDDPLIAKTIIALSGNWINFCERSSSTPPEDFVFLEKDFIQTYQILQQRGDNEPPPLLEGQFDIQNRANGYLGDTGKLQLPNIEKKEIEGNPDENK